MTRPVLPPTPDVPDSTVSELHALYHQGAAIEPSPLLDQNILAAARAELRADGARPSRPQAPWWKFWLTPASAIAVAVLGLSLTWHMMDEQELDLRKEMSAAQDKRKGAEEAVGKVTPAENPTATQPSIHDQIPAPGHRDELKAARNLPNAEQDQAAQPAPATEPRPFPARQEAAKSEVGAAGSLTRSTAAAPAPPPAAPAAMAAPLPATETLKKNQRSDAVELREKRDTSDAISAGSGSAPPLGRLEAKRRAGSGAETEAAASASSTAKSATSATAKPVDDAATPDAWLKLIGELRAAGRNAEAAQSLARFRGRYPDFRLPDDLINLK